MEQKMQFEHQLDPEGYYFSEPESLPPERAERRFFWGEDGHIHVKNLSAFWIPELTVSEVIHGTTYVVTGSYEGTENFVRKLERITSRWRIQNDKHPESWYNRANQSCTDSCSTKGGYRNVRSNR